MQGKTLDYFIVSLGKRGAGVYPKLKLVDLHVLVSRVRLGARLFVVGLNPDDVDHLRQLRPSEVLGIWEHGYNQITEMWEPELAVAYAAERVASRRAAEAKAGMIDEESPLVLRLRKQTEDNAAKNKRQVDLEMFANSQSGEFGPFSRYVPVEKQSGEFILVRYPDYERLKKQKKVVGQKFNNDADAKPYERVAPDLSGLPKVEDEDE